MYATSSSSVVKKNHCKTSPLWMADKLGDSLDLFKIDQIYDEHTLGQRQY